MKCFYHNDMDGRCAGYWVRDLLLDGCEMIPIDYKDKFPIETIQPREHIWIVDFSISPEEMLQLLQITRNVWWIDHHKTAIEKYADFPHPISGIRHDGISGCELTWLFINNKGIGERDKIPMATRLIGDRDTWQWVYGEDTRLFYAGMELRDTRPEADVWDEVHDWEDGCGPVIKSGRIVEQFKKIQRQGIVQGYAFWTAIEGHKAIACNSPIKSSELFDSVKEPYDLMIAYSSDGNVISVSLYSTTIDVSEIATKYGGGGHRGASGFQCTELPFKFSSKY